MKNLILIALLMLTLFACKKESSPTEPKDEWVNADSSFKQNPSWIFSDDEANQGIGFHGIVELGSGDFNYFIEDSTDLTEIVSTYKGYFIMREGMELTNYKISKDRLARGINEGNFFKKYPLSDYSVFVFTTHVGGYLNPKIVSFGFYKNAFRKEIEIRIIGKFPIDILTGMTCEKMVSVVKKQDIIGYKVRVVNNIVRP